MMGQQRRHVLVLTGPLTGHTGRLNGYKFENGRCVMLGTDEGVAGAKLYFSRTYRAYPEGSEELMAAQAEDETREEAAKEAPSDGERDIHFSQPDPAPDTSDSDVRPDGGGPSSPPAEDSVGDADSAARSEGSVPTRDGHSDSRVPAGDREQKQPNNSQQEPVNPKLLKAIYSLDPDNADHWTQAGLPKISVVEEAYGDGAVTRRSILSAAPGYDRESAARKAEEDALKDLA